MCYLKRREETTNKNLTKVPNRKKKRIHFRFVLTKYFFHNNFIKKFRF